MPASRKNKSYGQSDQDLEKLLAGMDRTRDLAARMLEMNVPKGALSPMVMSRAQFKSSLRAARGVKTK